MSSKEKMTVYIDAGVVARLRRFVAKAQGAGAKRNDVSFSSVAEQALERFLSPKD